MGCILNTHTQTDTHTHTHTHTSIRRVCVCVPGWVDGGALLLTREVDVDQREVLHDLLHLLELKQRREAALAWARDTGRERGERERDGGMEGDI